MPSPRKRDPSSFIATRLRLQASLVWLQVSLNQQPNQNAPAIVLAHSVMKNTVTILHEATRKTPVEQLAQLVNYARLTVEKATGEAWSSSSSKGTSAKPVHKSNLSVDAAVFTPTSAKFPEPELETVEVRRPGEVAINLHPASLGANGTVKVIYLGDPADWDCGICGGECFCAHLS